MHLDPWVGPVAVGAASIASPYIKWTRGRHCISLLDSFGSGTEIPNEEVKFFAWQPLQGACFHTQLPCVEFRGEADEELQDVNSWTDVRRL